MPNYTPSSDCGSHVVVVNAKNIKVTGNKLSKKIYYRHSGYPGGLKETSLSQQLEKPEKVILDAVKGMLPKNKLGRKMLTKLRVFSDENHIHAAQNPTEVKL